MSDEVALDKLHLDVKHLSPDQAVARLIEHAAAIKASDLFFVSNETYVGVHVRHLGLLRLVSVIPSEHGKRCMAHIKAVAGLDVAERRRPQDGRWIFERSPNQVLDLRINTIPTLYGEDFTLRLLDRTSRLLNLEQLGLLRPDFNQLLSMLNNSSGLILVTGPTGSGKTTTLYSFLSYLNNSTRKINTIEDPIEYSLAGVRQSQVHHKLEVDFPELLRSVLRQAPDVIMIGEVRDPVTAETAVRAANSGHLVLATLHAPIAAGAIQSMLSLGVHPHFLASSLLGAIAQRLIRTLCPECKTSIDLTDAPRTFDEVRKWLEPEEGRQMFAHRGCDACYHSGYTSRTGVFEVLTVSPDIRKMILERQPIQVLRQKAIEQGLIEFRHSALLKVANGETTFEEVFRAVPAEYLSVEE